MKLLFIAELHSGSTALMRFESVDGLVNVIEGVDCRWRGSTTGVHRVLERGSWRLGWPLDVQGLNERAQRACEKLLPDVVWVEKGVTLRGSTLRAMRDGSPGAKLVHYNPDDPFGEYGKGGWRTFLAAIPEYDVHFVPRRENVLEYERAGARRVLFNVPTRGFDPRVHRRYEDRTRIEEDLGGNVGFFGGYEAPRAASLRAVANAGIGVRVAASWESRAHHPNLHVAPYDVRGEAYARALGACRIGLGFLRRANRDRHTSRSIEIPACGAMLLGERTDEHEQLFEEGREAEYFSSDDELIEKLRFYLADESARRRVATAGHARCAKSGYDYRSRMQQMLEQAQGALTRPC